MIICGAIQSPKDVFPVHRSAIDCLPFTKPLTVNDSDLDSVTLKAYKLKDCGQYLRSDNFI